MAEYPKREKFYANRFCRTLTKSAAAQEIGAEACWMLTVIAHQEDSKRYKGAVTYYNEQLMPLCDFGSHKRLIAARNRAVKAGWLHYEAGGKSRAGRYWTIIPPLYEDLPDTPMDESSDDFCASALKAQKEACASKTEAQKSSNPPVTDGLNGSASAAQVQRNRQPSYPIPNTHTQGVEPAGVLATDEFRATWRQWLAHLFAKGTPLTEPAQLEQLMALARLGHDKALADVRFSIRKNANQIWDSSRDYAKGRPAKSDDVDISSRPTAPVKPISEIEGKYTG